MPAATSRAGIATRIALSEFFTDGAVFGYHHIAREKISP
jgi:hypothetical protein